MRLAHQRRDKASTFDRLMATGTKTLALSEPVERRCSACFQTFLAHYLDGMETVCPTCVQETVRLSEAEIRASRTAEERRRLAAMGLEGKLTSMKFATFAPAEQPEAFEKARQFAAAWPNMGGMAFLGLRGTGKTHLAVAILQEVSDAFVQGRYVHLPSLASDLAMARDWQDTASRLFIPLYKTPILVLDDAGRERAKVDSAWSQMLDTLLDRRSNGGYPTVIAANLTRPELALWLGDAGASRFLSVAQIVDMLPGDRRFTRPLVPPLPPVTRDVLTACDRCQGAGWVVNPKFRPGNPDRLEKCSECDGAGY